MKIPLKMIFALLAMTALLAFTVCSVGAARDREGIYENTLRLHVLANSDGEEDQKLKLAVRDAVLAEIAPELNACQSKEEAEKLIFRHSEQIEKVAEKVIADNGKSYSATLTLTEEEYPERTYGNITLPAGRYSSVRILLGEAEGQNWWCVLFPQVCTDTAIAAEEKLVQVGFTPNQIRILTEGEKPTYRLKFKIAELISGLFN